MRPPIGEVEAGRGVVAERRFQGRLTIFMPQRGRARTLDSVETIVNWLNVALYRLGRESGAKLAAEKGAEMRGGPLRVPCAPGIPGVEVCECLFEAFFETVNLLYPVVDRQAAKEALTFAQTYGLDLFVEKYGVALMMQMYLILLLGASSKPDLLERSYVDEVRDYCKTLQGHVLAYHHLDTVGAAVLMTLHYIFQGQETAAWAMLIQTCVMATTVGIKVTTPRTGGDRRLGALDYGERVWWALYCLEKQYAFELGRSSNILELPREHPVIRASDGPLGQEDAAFIIVTSLARTLQEISTACTSVGEREDKSLDAEALRGAIAAKVATTGECVALLGEWARRLPEKYR